VIGLGLYDLVLSYEDVAKIPPSVATVYVDFSGKDTLRAALHAQCGTDLKHDCYAGSAANVTYLVDGERYSPQPQPFFAPNQIRKRNKDWGADVLAGRIDEAQRSFLKAVAAPDAAWMKIETGHGFSDAARVIAMLYKTGGSPNNGYTVNLSRE
jgi:hypothetical protein